MIEVLDTYGRPVRLRSLASAEVAQGPRSISKHTQLTAIAKEIQEWLQSIASQDIVSAGGTVTGNVTESPDSLLAHVRLGAGQEFNEDGYSTGLDDNLGLGRTSRRDISESPGSFKLDQGVGGSQKLDKSRHDSSLDDLFDRRVPFLGE